MDVLIVDNEPAFAELLAARLELQGYSARSAGSGEEALKKLKERPCDVALLGVHLVGMSGLELLSRMRRKWPQTPCIMLTEPAQAEQGAEAMRFGAYDWLAKPVSMASVESALERALGRQKAERQHELYAEAARMRTLDRLTKGVAHGVNNPVNIMVQAAGDIGDILQEEPACHLPEATLEELKDAVETIKRQSRRVKSMMQSLLVLSQGTGRRKMGILLRDVVREVIVIFQERMRAQGVRPHVKTDSAIPVFMGEPFGLRQVLLHLVENALDAMPQGGVLGLATMLREARTPEERAMIELSELENSGYPEGGEMRAAPRFVEIRVTDTGRGVPEEIRRQIFAPFFSTSRGKSGIGHGLAVCRGLVQEMGGRIFLERGDPGSTVFTVRLPFIPCCPESDD